MWPAGGGAGRKHPPPASSPCFITSRSAAFGAGAPRAILGFHWKLDGLGPGSGAAWHKRGLPSSSQLGLYVLRRNWFFCSYPRKVEPPDSGLGLRLAVLSRTNQPSKLPVFRERLFSFTAAKWRTCLLSVANRKGFSKTKILELSGPALAVCIRC